MQTTELLTPTEMAYALDISEFTLQTLAHYGKIPCAYTQIPGSQDKALRFDPYIVMEWLQSNPQLDISTSKNYIEGLREQYKTRFPRVLQSLKSINAQFSPPQKGKGYSLAKVKNKKYGYLYYVRYIENGKLIPSRWNTRTKDLPAAEAFARENREKLLVQYHARHDNAGKFYRILGEYYEAGSEYMKISETRGRTLADKTRCRYHAFVTNVLIPYFKAHNITTFTDVTQPVITRLQDHLLKSGNKPQTVNKLISCARLIFDYLVMHGAIPSNPFRGIVPIKPRSKDIKIRGCYEIDTLKDIFHKTWDNGLHYLLCLVIYTTNMRNSEITRIQVRDIITIAARRFIVIPKSKSENGERMVPLHPFVYGKIARYIGETRKQNDDRVFQVTQSVCAAVNLEMGRLMGKTPEDLKAENITYYSGRHFWKTAMHIENLGEVEEYFMGHKVTNDVAVLYDHKDKVGQQNILAKADDVFRVLDKYLALT
jgi:site-specific recombinase XerD